MPGSGVVARLMLTTATDRPFAHYVEDEDAVIAICGLPILGNDAAGDATICAVCRALQAERIGDRF